ncbi:MAG: dUTP diphosphatase [Alphaproteobacteria bacterium]|nr:dUTP diphosphatase [Alphaproteobacteria bacterium]OJV45359.1 MAG: deoxyuridine 5'-triphosphate nucleotidohydrolase [Alphaproteobacteria bacterium 43-37]
MNTHLHINMQKLPHGENLPLPSHATSQSAGLDLMAAIDESIVLPSLQRTLVPTGFILHLPDGYEAQVRPRSGLALKNGISVLNTPGTIDSDYRGEVKVILINFGEEPFTIERGMRIAQMVIAPVCRVTLVDATQDLAALNAPHRGGGFGSTGL